MGQLVEVFLLFRGGLGKEQSPLAPALGPGPKAGQPHTVFHHKAGHLEIAEILPHLPADQNDRGLLLEQLFGLEVQVMHCGQGGDVQLLPQDQCRGQGVGGVVVDQFRPPSS